VYIVEISPRDVDFGRQVWQTLRTSKTFRVLGVLWLFQSDEWRLWIATPRVDEIGSRRAYAELSEVTRRMAADSDQLLRIVLVSPQTPLYQGLRSVFAKTASVEGARLGNTQIGGRYIDDAYLYEIR